MEKTAVTFFAEKIASLSPCEIRLLNLSDLIEAAVLLRSERWINLAKLIWNAIVEEYPQDVNAMLVVIHSTWDLRMHDLSAIYSKMLYDEHASKDPFLSLTLYDSNILAGTSKPSSTYLNFSTLNDSPLIDILHKFIEYDFIFQDLQTSFCNSRKKRRLLTELIDSIRLLSESDVSIVSTKTDYSCICLRRLNRIISLSKSTHSSANRAIRSKNTILSFNPAEIAKPSLSRYLVSTIPKAGTHLFGKILESAGLINSSWFIENNRVIIEIGDFIGANRIKNWSYSLNQMNVAYNKLEIDSIDALALIPNGRFAMTHIMPNSIPRDWLISNNTFLLLRDPWECIISAFYAELQLASSGLFDRDPEIDFILDYCSHSTEDEWLHVWIKYYSPILHDLYSEAMHSVKSGLPNVHPVFFDRLSSNTTKSYLESILLKAGIPALQEIDELLINLNSISTPTRSRKSDLRDRLLSSRNHSQLISRLYSQTGLQELYAEIQSSVA